MKSHELKLLLLFEREPLLRASIRELSRRGGLNYRSAYESAEHFIAEGVLREERHGQVRVCSVSAGEGAIAAMTEVSLARWLLLHGKGPLAAGGQGHPDAPRLARLAGDLALASPIFCGVLVWDADALPRERFTLLAVTLEKARAANLLEELQRIHGPAWCRCVAPDELQRELAGKRWLVLTGHERFWRLLQRWTT